MAGKKHSPEQVVRKLREAEADLAAGQSVGQVCQKLGVTEATFQRWRNRVSDRDQVTLDLLHPSSTSHATITNELIDAIAKKVREKGKFGGFTLKDLPTNDSKGLLRPLDTATLLQIYGQDPMRSKVNPIDPAMPPERP
jgi:transposase-like protein